MRLHLRRSLPALLPLAVGALASGTVVVAMVVTLLPAFFVASSAGSDSLGIGAWRALAALPDIGTTVALTWVTGVGATLLSFVLACCLCTWAMTPGRLRPTLVIAAAVAAVPPAALAAGVASLSWPAGAWWARWAPGSHTGAGLMIVVLSLKEAPFLAAMMLIALPRVAVEGHAALAATLGYSRAEAFAKVALPQIIPRMRLPVWAALAWSLSAVSVASILGPEAPPTLAMVAWRGLGTDTAGQHGVGAAAAGLVLALVVAAIVFFRALERIAAHAVRAWLGRGGRGRVAGAVAGAGTAIAATGLVIVVAAIVRLLRSWAGPSARTDSASPSQALLGAVAGPSGAAAGSPDAAFAMTLIIGAVATLIALAMAIACLEAEDRARVRGGWPILLWVPWVVPQIAVVPGMAWILSNADTGVPMAGIIVMAGMIVAQLVFVFPCV
ncbi:MAG: hypothetical protein ACREX6_05220, partial [Casimicrobiaceae bacterium]